MEASPHQRTIILPRSSEGSLTLTPARMTQVLNLLKLHPALLHFLRAMPMPPREAGLVYTAGVSSTWSRLSTGTRGECCRGG